MKKKYGRTIQFQKNRAKKIARNKMRRNEFSQYSRRDLTPIKQKNSMIPIFPKEIELLSFNTALNRGSYNFNAPEILDLTNNYEQTIEFISMIAASLKDKNDNIDLQINFNGTKRIDIGSLSIIDDIVVKGIKYSQKTGRGIHVHGLNPTNLEANTIFSYSGLPKIFGITNETNPRIVTLDPLESQVDTNTETMRIISYYNECLKRSNYELNDKGKSFFMSLINEIVDNAIIHSNKKKPIYLSGGYYNYIEQRGQLSIISFGNTFYDTLSSKASPIEIKNDIGIIVEKHRKLNYKYYDIENIWTVCGLQSGVSCMKNGDDLDRGSGTIKFIEAFMTLGQTSKQEKPKMSLISGSTQILFDGKYQLSVNANGHKIIAFNDKNDINQEPDHNYVKSMKYRFPGVIINIEFYIDREYLSKFERKENEETD